MIRHSFTPRVLLTRILSQPRSWFRAVVRRNRLEAEMEAELAYHLENLTQDLVRSGLSPSEARRRARIAMGSMLRSKEEMRGSLGLRWWDEVGADLRYGARTLGKSPGFTAIAATSLALAIGANTTIFSVAKQLLYDRLAVPHAAELRLLAWTGSEEHVAVHSTWGDYEQLPGSRVASNVFSYQVFQQLGAENRVLEYLFAFKRESMNATIRGTAQRVRGEMVSGNYYAELGVQPVLGRGITPADDAKPGQGAAAVISYGLWEREFGRSPTALGQTIRVNNTPLTIVGVNPRGFTSAAEVQTPADVVMPLSMQPLVSPMPGKVQPLFDPNLWWVNIMGRAKPGVSDATAQVALDTQLAGVVHGTMTVKKEDDLPRMDLRDGSRGLFEQQQTFGKPMAVLMTLVGFVLLLACANIANLMLARGAERQREMSVRLALGAGRMRILRQMLVESLMLAAGGGVCGLLLAYLGRNAIPRMLENAWEQNGLQVHFDWGVFAFTAVVTIATGVLFGLAPAIAAAHENVSGGLKSAALTATRRRRGLGGRALIGFQIALSTLLVICAGLFLRTLAGLKAVDVGFRTDHLLILEVNPNRIQYPPGKDVLLHRQLAAAFASVPGVEAVTPAQMVYISDSRMRSDFVPEGKERDKNSAEYYNVVGNNFFETLGIPIVAGRGFGSQDTATSLKVGVINRSLARKAFPDQNPLGKRFATSERQSDGHYGKEWIEIVGVCADTRYSDLRAEPPPQYFLLYLQQREVGSISYQIRTAMKPEALVPGLRRVAQRIAPDLPLSNVRTQEQQIEAAMQQERVFVTLTSGFGLLALALAAVGVYGIMAYSVAQRTHEIGIRLAVGAQPGQVRRMILRESAWLAVAGTLAGAIAALLLSHLVTSMLYGIRPDDPVTLGGGALILLLVALAATWIPARRAAGVQPIVALRHE
jgi:predicted permease